MKKLIYFILAGTACLIGACSNSANENQIEETDSIRYADSMAAVDATDSINAFNDSISRADSLDNLPQ